MVSILKNILFLLVTIFFSFILLTQVNAQGTASPRISLNSVTSTASSGVEVTGQLTQDGIGVAGAKINIKYYVSGNNLDSKSPVVTDEAVTSDGSLGKTLGAFSDNPQNLAPSTGYTVTATYLDASTSQNFTSPSTGTSNNTGTNGNGPGTVGGVFGNITPPDALKNLLALPQGQDEISSVLSKVVELIYIFAAILFVFYLLYAALKFIYSEGHKESVQDAKGTITWAIIGVIIMSLTFVILRIVGNITGFKFFN